MKHSGRHPKVQRFLANNEARRAQHAANADIKSKTALVLGGGAPNSALMAGAMAAFDDHKIAFDVVSTSGAGGLIGLLWLAPKCGSGAQALRKWVDSYVSDPIYSVFPVDYKVFFKPGIFADMWRQWLALNPLMNSVTDEQGDSFVQRLFSDTVLLGMASLSPSSLNFSDVGLCARVPWIDQMVDFDKVKSIAPYFYLNAYNLTDQVMDNFTKDEIGLDHFKAAFAFPFIYGPYELNGKDYYEGASHDCLNFQDMLARHPNLETVVIFDVLGHDSLIRRPRNLYDSWVLSMIIPLVKVAEDNLTLFIETVNGGRSRKDGARTDVLTVPFPVPEDHLDDVLDWSYSNGKELFRIGYESAVQFLLGDGKHLPRRK